MIAARQIAFGKAAGKDLSAKDYVQDGLVAMWDGIENAGWGTHDQNNRLRNLVDGGSYGDFVGGIIGENHLHIDSCIASSLSSASTEYITAELCVDYTNSNHTSNVIFMLPNINSTSNSLGAYSWNNNTPLRVFRSASWETIRNPPIVNDRLFTTITNVSRTTSGTLAQLLYRFGVAGEYLVENQDDNWASIYALKNEGKVYFGANGFQMNIHSMRIYSRALAAEEIAHNYEIDKARFGL